METASPGRRIAARLLIAISLVLFVRGLAFFAGSGPHDGEDIPAFSVLATSSVALFGAVALRWDGRPGHRRRSMAALLVASGVVLLASGWLVLNMLADRWAS